MALSILHRGHFKTLLLIPRLKQSDGPQVRHQQKLGGLGAGVWWSFNLQKQHLFLCIALQLMVSVTASFPAKEETINTVFGRTKPLFVYTPDGARN